MTQEKETIHVRVYQSPPDGEARGQGQKGKYFEYEIPYVERMTVLNVCSYIYENYGRNLSFYYSCRIGKCLGCLMDVDGRTRFACTTLAKDGMTIGPAKKFNLVKDLFVDLH